MIDFECPHCGRRMQTTEKHAGKTCSCKNCGEDVVIPSAVVVQVDVIDSPPGRRVRTLERRLRRTQLVATLAVCVAILSVTMALTGGRSDVSSPPAVDARPYTSTLIQAKDAFGIGVQHRTAKIVVPDPASKEAVLSAAKAVYNRYRDDIEAQQPDAKHKKINLRIFDSQADADADRGEFILHVTSHNLAGPTIPEFEDAEHVVWNWRSPEFRPSARDRQIHADFWNSWAVLDRPIDSVLVGLRTAYKMDDEELTRIIARVSCWRSGLEPNDENVAMDVGHFKREWNEERAKALPRRLYEQKGF